MQSNDSFLQLDSDHDNRVSRKEAIGVDDFELSDRNSDGFLNFGEYSLKGMTNVQATQTNPQIAPGVASSADARLREWAAAKMKSRDKDNDGFLSREEFNDDDKFEKADLNKDGRIDVDEFANSRR